VKTRKQYPETTIEALRKLAEDGAKISDAARQLGLTYQQARMLALYEGIRFARREKLKRSFDYEVLVKASQMPLEEAATWLGVSKATLRKRLASVWLKPLPRNKSRDQEVLAAVREGNSDAEVASRFGISRQTVWSIRRRYKEPSGREHLGALPVNREAAAARTEAATQKGDDEWVF
jgi:predicted DNA-binding protein (UPF0251 family)